MNQQAPKKSLLPSTNNKKTRILIFLLGVVLLAVVAIVIFSLLTAGERGQTAKLVEIAGRQNEIVRVSDLAADKAKNPDTRALAITTKLSLASAQKSVLNALKKQGHKPSDSDLNLYKNTKTDDQLKTAEQNGTYDQVFLQIINDSLAKYQAVVKETLANSQSATEKQALNLSFVQVSTLLVTSN